MRSPDLTVWTIVLALGLLAREARGQALFEAPATKIEHWAYFDQPHVAVPLTLKAGVVLNANSARTVRVRVGDEPRQALIPAFKPKVLAPAQLDIEVDINSLPAPATYAVALELAGTAGKPGEAATQTVELTWTLTAGKLAPIASIVARDERLWWPRDNTPIRLLLHETSGRAKLTGITLSEPDPPMNDGAPAALLDLNKVDEKDLQDLPPGAERAVRVLRPTSFGVGTTTGKIAIRAPQLTDAVVVPYEIRTRIHDWVIIPLFLLMGFIGWYVRQKLKDREAIVAMRAELEPLAEQATTLALTDPSAGPALSPAQKAAREAIDAGDPAVARSKLDDFREKVAAALKARSDAIATLAQEVLPLRLAVEQPLELPASVEIQPARDALAAAGEALSNQDLAGATAARDRAVGALDVAGENMRLWTDAARDALTALASPGLSKSARNEGRALTASADERLKQVPAFNKVARPEWGSYLRNSHDSRWYLARLVERSAPAFLKDVGDAVAALRKATGKTPADGDALQQAARLDVAALAATDPVDALHALHAAIAAVTDLVNRHVPSAAARALLTEGDYAGAIAKQVSIDEQTDVSLQIASGGEQNAITPPGIGAPAGPRARESVPQMFVRRQPAEPIAAARADLAQVRRGRAVVSALVLAIVAWVVYRGAWVGTVNDFVGVSVAAFFTDFTLDAVLTALGKLKKS